MLLIDEIDRADDEFEAFLLEVLSDFQITIPEIGTIAARRRPTVILTSNRTRELHDALKRRCLFHWISHPALEREVEILRLRVPGVPERLAAETAAFVAGLRGLDLAKAPGVAETIDWTQALVALGCEELDATVVEQTLGAVLKYHEDFDLRPRRRRRRAARRGARGGRGRRPRERGPHTPPRHLRPRAARGRPRGRPGAHGGRAARPRPRRHHAPGRRLLDAAHDARRPARGPRAVRPRLRRLVPAPRRARAGAPRDRSARAAQGRQARAPRPARGPRGGAGRRRARQHRPQRPRGPAPQGLRGDDAPRSSPRRAR